ncbi:CoA transferase [Hyphomicrobium sp.]|uniref:CoA transferase n=1 Tax=Hyphomicrobium sp. TaxID=82 RepID=UPI001DEC2881|nr:CoA transferase [Hyphomicrobium sp.]MBY0562449.1 CoA transferase [Hyphomicrobium sp.]
MRILELGGYIAPAYCGMLLAEQGHTVTKWTNGRDPIHALVKGDELWAWINHGKELQDKDFRDVEHVLQRRQFDVVVDNIRPSTLARAGIDPAALARDYNIRWVSLRGETAGKNEPEAEISFDVKAQARATMHLAGWIPFYIGDTSAGLWLAFKAVAERKAGHFVVGHAACLAKLVEGELIVDRPGHRSATDGKSVPWDVETYYGDAEGAHVLFKGQTITEPVRDRAWQLAHIANKNGRVII